MPDRGQDVKILLRISYAEASAGCWRLLAVERSIVCPNCRGTQARGGTTRRCPSCNATGKQQHMRGPMIVQTPCDECEGRGRIPEMWCERCDRGIAEDIENMRISLPAGIATGYELVVTGKGKEVVGGEPGDLIFVIDVDMIDVLVTVGDDVVLETFVPARQRLFGGSLEVATLDGPTTIKVPARVRDRTVLTLPGRGHVRAAEAPRSGDPYRDVARGEQRIILRVAPLTLSPRARRILQISLVAAGAVITYLVIA